MSGANWPSRRITVPVEQYTVAGVAVEGDVEKVLHELGAVYRFHGVAEPWAPVAADVPLHAVQRVRHRVDGVDNETQLGVLDVVKVEGFPTCVRNKQTA